MGLDPATGRYRQRTKTFRGTEKQARKALAAFVAEMETATHHSSDVTVAQLMDAWLEWVADRVSPNTLQGYRSKARHRIVPAFGDVPLRKLKASDLERWYARLLRDEDLAPARVRQVHAIVRNALAQAVRWEWLAANPAAAARPPSVPKRQIQAPEVRDVLAALQAANREFGVFVRVAAAAGARRGEVGALRWSDVDLDAGELLFANSVYRDPGTGDIRLKDTKAHGNRRIALDELTVAALRQHRQRAQHVADSCATTISDGSFVFSPDPDGRWPWDPYKIRGLVAA